MGNLKQQETIQMLSRLCHQWLNNLKSEINANKYISRFWVKEDRVSFTEQC